MEDQLFEGGPITSTKYESGEPRTYVVGYVQAEEARMLFSNEIENETDW